MGSSFQYIEGGEDWHAEPANRLASSEKQDKKPKGEKEMSEEAIAAEEKQKSVPLRDEKGHFIGKCKHDKKNAEKNEDPNVVKIKIVKEKKPKMPKNIIGKLNDLKERTASKFLESVIANAPSRILIDGKNYYSEKYVSKLREDLEIAEQQEAEAVDCMDELQEDTKKLLDSSKLILKELDKSSYKWRLWRSIALGMLAGYVIAFATAFARVYVLELERNNPQAQVTTATK